MSKPDSTYVRPTESTRTIVWYPFSYWFLKTVIKPVLILRKEYPVFLFLGMIHSQCYGKELARPGNRCIRLETDHFLSNNLRTNFNALWFMQFKIPYFKKLNRYKSEKLFGPICKQVSWKNPNFWKFLTAAILKTYTFPYIHAMLLMFKIVTMTWLLISIN